MSQYLAMFGDVGYRKILHPNCPQPDPGDCGGCCGEILQQGLGQEEEPQQDDGPAVPRGEVLAV